MAEDVAYILQHAEVDVVICDAEFLPQLSVFQRSRANVPILVDTDTDADNGESGGPFNEAVLQGLEYDQETGGHGWQRLETQAADEEDVIALAYTSGTTAQPKGVEYTHRGAYLAAVANVVESGLNYHSGRAKYLWTLPMFHAGGWTFPWAVTAVRGTHYCLRKVDYDELWRLFKEETITHLCAAPTVNTLLCAAPSACRLPNPVRVTVAASPPSAHLLETMVGLNMHPVHVYGMTETYGPITKCYPMVAWESMPAEDKYAKMARQGCGFVLSQPVRVVRTDQPDDVLVDVAKNGEEIGEIVFQGNICAKGYYRDEEATKKLWAGGVLHSGDLAVWHDDGTVQILDRAKDIIISGKATDGAVATCRTVSNRRAGGENISSIAVEARLVQHADVLEAAVVAVPDAQWGERPKAFVTVKPGKQVRGASMVEWARSESGMGGLMAPREVAVVKELPKTSTGKVKKNVLRERARGT